MSEQPSKQHKSIITPDIIAHAMELGVPAAAREAGVSMSAIRRTLNRQGLTPPAAHTHRKSVVSQAAVNRATEIGINQAAKEFGHSYSSMVAALKRAGLLDLAKAKGKPRAAPGTSITPEVIARAMEVGPCQAAREFGLGSAGGIYHFLNSRGLRKRNRRKKETDKSTKMLSDACAHATPGLPWTLEMIGEAGGITRERARQIEANGLKNLRIKLMRVLNPDEFDLVKGMFEPKFKTTVNLPRKGKK